MTIEAVVRQFFMDFIENLGYHVDERKEFEDEECNMILPTCSSRASWK